MRSKKAVGPLTPQFIVLYVLAAIVTLVFYLVMQGYAAQSVPRLVIENELEVNQEYLADLLVTLPNSNSQQFCLAKSTDTQQGEIIYPGLLPSTKLDAMQNAGRTAGGGTRMCVTLPENEGVYYAKNLDWGAIVNDTERTNAVWHINTAATSAKGKSAVERLVAIEYPSGIVHTGKVQLWVCEGACE